MHIKQLTVTNWQGRTAAYPLSPITLITGANQRGKTSLANAIRCGLIGYNPKHGKRSKDTFGFAGSNRPVTEVGVKLDFQNGPMTESVSRRWFVKGKSISEEVVGEIEIPPVLVDIAEYLSLSGPDKARYIFSMADAQSVSKNSIIADIRKALKPSNPTEHTEQSIDELISVLKRHHEGTMQEWLDDCFEEIKESRKKCSTTCDSMLGSKRATVELAAAERVVQFDAEQLKFARSKLTELNASILGEDIRKRTCEAASYERERTRRKLAEMPDKSDALEACKLRLVNLEQKIGAYESATDYFQRSYNTCRDNLSRAQTQKQNAEDVLAKLDSEIASLESQRECPYCGGDMGKKSKNLIKELVAKVEAVQRAIPDIEKVIAEAAEQCEKIELEIAASRAADAEHKKLTDQFIAASQEMRRLSEYQNDRANLHRALEAVAPEYVAPKNLEFWISEKGSLEKEVESLEAAQKLYIAHQADERRKAEAEDALVIAESNLEIYQQAIKEIDAIKLRIKDAVFGGLMRTVNLFTQGIITDTDGKEVTLEYKDGEIGYWYYSIFVPLERFSGTQELITLAGLAVALAQSSPFRIVFLDEMGRLSPDNKVKFHARCNSLIKSGVLDQAIMIDVSDTDYNDVYAEQPLNIIRL